MMGNWNEDSWEGGLGEMLLSIPREMRVPEDACVRGCACQGGLFCGFLVGDAMGPGCSPCVFCQEP